MVNKKLNTVAIILARGGSKGIPKKNVKDFCGRPLLLWTLNQLKSGQLGMENRTLTHIWVSSDNEEILDLADSAGVNGIRRPPDISDDCATSESGWLHAINVIEERHGKVDLVVAPQVTSPVRSYEDFDNAINKFTACGCDSMFSATYAVGLYMWSRLDDGTLKCEGYDSTNPNRRRQDMHGVRYTENGSFYLFTPQAIRTTGTRFGKDVEVFEMPRWKSFEIDDPEDFKFCEMIAKTYLPSQFMQGMKQ